MGIEYKEIVDAWNYIYPLWEDAMKNNKEERHTLSVIQRLIHNYADTELSANDYNKYLDNRR